jgi:hypothetical protein
LPNLIALNGPSADTSRHIVREFIPFTGGPGDSGPIADELASLVEDGGKRAWQVEALGGVVERFAGHCAGKEAAGAIAGLVEG